jgi:MoaA/NifB/PqqE/SkfB family radical SAM enzyme
MQSLSASVYFDSIKKKNHDFVKSIQLEILSDCPCKCVMCKQWKEREQSYIEPEKLTAFFKEYKRLGGCQISITGGDPIYYKDFVKVFSQDHDLRFDITTTLITNDKEKLDLLSKFKLIIVSISGADEMYKNIHGINAYDLVIKNLTYLREKGLKFKLNTILSNDNLTDLSWVEKYVNDMNILQPKYVTFLQNLFSDENLKNVSEFMKIINSKATFKHSNCSSDGRKNKSGKEKKFQKCKCIVPYLHWHVKPTGDVYPCCIAGGEVGQDLDKSFCFGNIFVDGLDVIYKNGTDFVDKLNENIYDKDLCKHMCANGVRYYLFNKDFDSFCKGKFIPRI